MELNVYFLFYICSVVLAAVSQILLKKSALKEHDGFLKEYVNPYVIGGYALTGISMLLTVLAFRGMEYKNGPIIESLGYILVMFFGIFVFREKLTKRKCIGTLLILAGIFVYYL
ncbi:MAG: EamA family transporter [Lachnospiraceae bacterium]|nr:EamA family transporter [Lachnospiraceae bacterium]